MCHPPIEGELAWTDFKKREDVLTLLSLLPMGPEVDSEEALEFTSANELREKGIGLVDVLLLASSRLAAVPLWTRDRKLEEAAQRLDLSHE
jgi:predicted nucleic acid-binding protein